MDFLLQTAQAMLSYEDFEKTWLKSSLHFIKLTQNPNKIPQAT
jgi:hypothetical protein